MPQGQGDLKALAAIPDFCHSTGAIGTIASLMMHRVGKMPSSKAYRFTLASRETWTCKLKYSYVLEQYPSVALV